MSSSHRLNVQGDSAGGHLASLLGLTGNQPDLEGHSGSPGYSSSVQAVIARVAPSDFLQPDWHMIRQGENPVTRLFGGSIQERAELMRLASPITHVTSSAPPFQIVHGTHDETVPFEQAERFVAALQEVGAKVDFIPIQGVYHNLRNHPDLPWAEENWEQLGWQALSFFQKHIW
ncbi:MAG: prolyl oligopeptidase family serine peptidase [Ktedonobacteraceae bacterium]